MVYKTGYPAGLMAGTPAARGRKEGPRREIDLLFAWLDRSPGEKQIIKLLGSILSTPEI